MSHEEGEYTFVSDTGEGEKISFSYRGKDKYISIDAEKVLNATVTSDGVVKVSGNEGEFSLTAVTDTPTDGEFDSYTLSGNKQGDFELDLSADTVKVNGTDLNGLTLKGNDAIISDEIVIDSNQKELEFGRKNNEVVVLNSQNEENPEKPALSDQAKAVVKALNREDVSSLKKEDSERIRNLLDQYKALSEEDKNLIPEETKNKAAALTEWLSKLNESSDPSDSENPEHQNPSDQPGGSSADTNSADKEVPNDSSDSQNTGQTYNIAPGTGISDQTIITAAFLLADVLTASGVIFATRRGRKQN